MSLFFDVSAAIYSCYLLFKLMAVLDGMLPPWKLKFSAAFAAMFLLESLLLLTGCFWLVWEPAVRLNKREPAPALPPKPPPAVWAETAPPERADIPDVPDKAWVADVPPPSM